MAKFTLSLIPVFNLLFLLLSPSFGELMKVAKEEEKTWCVAKPSSSDAELIANINYVCSELGNDRCKIIQKGGCCYNPSNNINHASIAMNIYYQYMGRNYWNCNFRGSGLIVKTNPSYPNCEYA